MYPRHAALAIGRSKRVDQQRRFDRPPAVLVASPGGTAEQGGMGRLLTTVLRHWQADWPALLIVDPWGPGVVWRSPFYLARALAQVVWASLHRRAGLLHVHMASRGSVVRKGLLVYAGKMLGLPVLLHIHAGDFCTFFLKLPPIAQRVVRGALMRADRIVVIGDCWRDELIETVGIKPERVKVLLNCAELPAAPRDRRRGDPLLILFLGRVTPEKGVPELLQALASDRLAGLDWRAQIVGAGDIEHYRLRTARLSLAGRVSFHGWVGEEHVRRYLATADVFVLPSHFEGASIAALEAMAHGLAIVMTPVGSARELVIDGVSGMLTPVGDVPALVDALRRVLSDDVLRQRLQAEASARFVRYFDPDLYCRRLANLYAELLICQDGAQSDAPSLPESETS